MVTLFPLFFLLAFAVCEDNVRYAAVIYRHGDRTPVNFYPNDPWHNESNWPVKPGQLTNEGKRQHFALGQWLRKRYAHLVSANFNPTEIYVRSTDVDRTLMSAQVNLAGMYPPKGQAVWNNDLNWQPVPVHTVPEYEDEVLAMKRKCPAFDREYEKLKRTTEYKNRLNRFQNLMEYLSINSGMKVKDYDDIVDIYSTLYIESLYNFTLPNWTASVFPDKMREPACYSFVTSTMTPMLARLKAGPFLQDVIGSMMYIISNETIGSNYTLPRLAIYSGHDYTIGNILNALGVFDKNCPPYTATIFMELIKVDVRYYVRISYRNSTEIVEPRVLILPHCAQDCPIARFNELYRNLLTVNWNYECGKQFPPLLGVSFFVGLAIFFTMYIVHKLHFARVSHNYGRQRSGFENLVNRIAIQIQR
ncbi:prostatic acid phosphatase isoform X2 [Manduca sexta]|uniref:prostatic acid phosphatase isoform X2 n=1 Tax=Manduca sexta TaxID=7130 RepID=UPI00188EE257|nr:prostatic acid phosphatase isoform X2 [Manduca sexta]